MHLAPSSAAPSGPASRAAGAAPVTEAEFAAAMARLGPFETAPQIAIAVSGGRDSLALALLAADWGRARGGALTALIVDHGLRPESAAEARHVAQLLRGLGIEAEVLPWLGAKPRTGLSEAARAARYEILQTRCRELGILHLLLGHQRDDQSETILLRLADASGPEGLAGMTGIVERGHLRLLRPLLDIGRDRLAATVLARGLAWVDDPSNRRAEYARVAARQSLSADARAVLIEIAAGNAALRHELDRRLAALAVELVSLDHRGFAWLDREGFIALPDAIARRLLGRLAACLGGRHYPSRRSGLDQAVVGLKKQRSAVAGGCRFIGRGKRILVCREAGAIAAPLSVGAGQSMLWDRRYVLALPPEIDGGAVIGKLGESGRCQAGFPELKALPAPVVEALPGLWRGTALRAVFLPRGLQKATAQGDRRGKGPAATLISCLEAVFQPAQGLAGPAWQLVLPSDTPMYLNRRTFSLRG